MFLLNNYIITEPMRIMLKDVDKPILKQKGIWKIYIHN